MQWFIDLIFGKMSLYFTPPGTIAFWYGLLADIPTGWHVCDGTNGTPNMLNSFMACASDENGGGPLIEVNGTPLNAGGTFYHDHRESTSTEQTELETGSDVESGVGFQKFSIAHYHVINTDVHIPCFRACWAMMKLFPS